jgi:hypothetical protein
MNKKTAMSCKLFCNSLHIRQKFCGGVILHYPHSVRVADREEEIRRENAAPLLVAYAAVDGVQPGGAQPAVELGRIEFDVLEVVRKSGSPMKSYTAAIALPGAAVSVS